MKQLRLASASVLAASVLSGVVLSGPASASACLDLKARLSVEERRLAFVLPDAADPARPQSRAFAQQMIEGGGFEKAGPALADALCRTSGLQAATKLVGEKGEALWQDAVRRAQRKVQIKGSLPYSDDRPLYWTRVQAMSILRQWKPSFALTSAQRAGLITAFDRASRGMFDISLPSGTGTKGIVISGFDPFTLDGGTTGTAKGTVGNNLRHGNPSGATALALDGTTYQTKDGKTARIEAYTLPVSYREFRDGYLEDTVGPLMKSRSVDASITISQGGGDKFDLEQWNARYHGVFPGNDNVRPCPDRNGPQLAVKNNECNTVVVDRWGGPRTFSLANPPQWTSTTLPVAEMIRARTGASVRRPPGDTWSDPSVAFGVIWNTRHEEFPDCNSNRTVTHNPQPPVAYPPSAKPVPPSPKSCSYNGGGGNYLSNESAYRNTLLRDRMSLKIPAGHIHTPDMQHFATRFGISDATFDAWRLAIVGQTRNLINVVADNA